MNEPSDQDLRCLEIQLFSSLVLKQLRAVSTRKVGLCHVTGINSDQPFHLICEFLPIGFSMLNEQSRL